MVAVGKYVKDIPEYSRPLKANDGSEVALSSFLGDTPVVIFFYPKAGTPGCTKEACSFRDRLSEFSGLAKVYGVSSDSVSSTRNFAEKQNLPYPLLSDEGGKLRSAMGVGRHYFIIPGRNTFVIDKTGRVILNYSDLNHKNHVKEALSALKNSNLE